MATEGLPDAIAQLHPEIAARFAQAQALSQENCDRALLALCGSYVEAALDIQAWQAPGRPLSEREAAYIGFTEQYVMAVSQLEREQVERLLAFDDADSVYAFVHALYLEEMRLRVNRVAKELLS